MEATCQRCHETLREADRYCPACGLPQLTYQPAELPAAAASDGAVSFAGQVQGSGQTTLAGGVAWRPALKTALMLAIPAGVVCSGLTPVGQSLILGVVWITGAAAWAVGLYARRARTAGLSMGAGARIGLVTGVFAGWLALGVDGVSLWVTRFVLHQGGQMDSLFLTGVEKSLEFDQQMMSQMGLASAQVAQSLQMSRSMMLSPEGRAGIALLGFATSAAFLIAFATLGGALGARLLAQPRRS